MKHNAGNSIGRVSGSLALTLGLLIAALGSPAVAAPPTIVKLSPTNGQTDVSPATRELSVTFDQDMNTGAASWVGGGENFPTVRDAPRWLDKRTCVLPVTLKPNWKYQVGINGGRFRNFRGAGGDAVEPVAVTFATGMADNAAAALELRKAIDEAYSYRDLRKVDWEDIYIHNLPALATTKDIDDFANLTAKILGHAKDVHIYVEAGGRQYPTMSRGVTPNINVHTVARVVPDLAAKNKFVYIGRFVDGIGYIRIDSWAGDEAKLIQAAIDGLKDFADAKGLIVDVRANNGGSETLAQQFAGCFVDKPADYASAVLRDTRAKGGFGPARKRTLKPNKDGPKYRGKLAVLGGPVCMSSCEGFLLMMKQVPRCKLIGAASYGASGNPQPYELGNGVVVYLPSWKAFDADGKPFEGVGIKPGMTVPATTRQLVKADPVVDAALKYLRGE